MPKKTTGKRSRQVDTYTSYMVAPESWDIVYGFGVTTSKWGEGPYSEYETLTIEGRLIDPAVSKQSMGNVTLDGRASNLDEIDIETPRLIGFLNGHGNTLYAYASVPIRSQDQLIALLIGKRVQTITIFGTPLRYRKGSIRTVEWSTRRDIS